MYILVINCGSATLKFKLFDYKNLKVQIEGIAERIGLSESFIELGIKKERGKGFTKIKDHRHALEQILEALPRLGFNTKEIVIVGHRVVHGGEDFTEPTLITPKVLKKLKEYIKLAPLHNPANIMGIEAVKKILPKVKNIAVFDTAFYKDLPPFAYTYGLPYEFYKKEKIRRYGFHGISHEFVSQVAAKKLKKPLSKINLITCHLGSGCSISAIKGGKAIDTSMGFTPLEGLMMSTRSGDIDPAIVFYLMKELKLNSTEIDNILNKKSGLLGVSGLKDMRDVLVAAGYKVAGYKGKKYSKETSVRAKLALNIFIYKIQKYIGAYWVALSGADAIVFTAGIGERNETIRNLISKGLKSLGKVKILAIPTNEELMIAKEVLKVK